MSKKRFLLATLLLLAGMAAVGWWQRTALTAWWHVRQLGQANEANREARIQRVAALGDVAVSRLLQGLTSPDAVWCANLDAALVRLAHDAAAPEPHAVAFLHRLRERFATLSPAGQATALRAATALLNQTEESTTLSVAAATAVGDMLKLAEPDPRLRPPMLHLAAALLPRVAPGQWLGFCRSMALDGFRDTSPRVRTAAMQLLLCEAMRAETDVLSHALLLLRDADPSVRRAAVLSLGSAQQVSEDELLPSLHDPDAQVQQACELALRGRGLQDRHLRLARLISDPNPAARLQVLHYLRDGDVDPTLWLRRLSHDASSAVRAAAVRAAAAQPRAELQDRLMEIVRADASPTVRELAAHYLARKPQP